MGMLLLQESLELLSLTEMMADPGSAQPPTGVP